MVLSPKYFNTISSLYILIIHIRIIASHPTTKVRLVGHVTCNVIMALAMKSSRCRYVTPWSLKEVHCSSDGMLINVTQLDGVTSHETVFHTASLSAVSDLSHKQLPAYQTVLLFSSYSLLYLFIYFSSSCLYITLGVFLRLSLIMP
jgi:hypothetical protein